MRLIDIGGQTIDIDEQLRDIERANCEESLHEFMVAAWKYVDPNPFVHGWPLEAVAEHLQAVCDGDIRRLIINIPPRCSKSSMTSVAFPAWVWAQRHDSPTSGPGVQFLTASFAQQLSIRDSVKTRRLLDSPWYQSLWGERFALTSDQNTKGRFDNNKGGTRLSTSVGSALTGEGGNCFVAGTLVSTPSGSRPIEALKVGDPVIAFDHSRGKVVISEVVATQVSSSNDLYQVRTLSGHRFVCTGAHPIFQPGRGYIGAAEMGRGDRIIIEKRAGDCSTPDLRLLLPIHKKTPLRSSQGAKTGKPGRILQQAMLLIAPRDKKYEAMRGLWQAAKRQASRILFSRMPAKNQVGQEKETHLPTLQSALRWLDGLLFVGLCGRRSLRKDAWGAKLTLQSYWPLFQSIQGNAPNCSRAGRPSLCFVPSAGQDCSAWQKNERISTGASHRRELAEQRARESNFSVPSLSQDASSWEVGAIASVTRISGSTQRVYDIQVKGCSNFFAEGILVHNCIIVDDPNAAQEAFSEATIHTTCEWWDSALSTRLNNPKTGALIVIQQRLAEDDLTGHILSKDIGDWTHLCLPMKYEWTRHSVSITGWNDPRGCDDDGEPLVLVDANGRRIPRDSAAQNELTNKREGTLLWPERFGPKEIDLLERQLGPFAAAGQLQQRPEPAGGGVIKTDWWQPWELESYPPFDYIIASLDTAYTTKTENDFSAMTVWGVFSATMAAASSNFVGRSGKRESQRDREAMFDEAMRVKNMTAGMGGSDSTPRVMLIYAWQARLELHELVSKVEKTARDMKVDKLIIENKAAGHSVAQEIRRLYNNADFAVQLVDPKAQDKLARLYSVQHLFAEGMVHAPDHSWAQEVITQTSQFPKGKHDDLVDTVSMALRHMRELGMLTRQQERVTEMENMKRYTGKQPTPLYPV